LDIFGTFCNRTEVLLRNQQRKGRKRRRIEEKDRNFIERNGLFEKATLLPWHSRCQEPPEFSRNELQTEYLPLHLSLAFVQVKKQQT